MIAIAPAWATITITTCTTGEVWTYELDRRQNVYIDTTEYHRQSERERLREAMELLRIEAAIAAESRARHRAFIEWIAALVDVPARAETDRVLARDRLVRRSVPVRRVALGRARRTATACRNWRR